MSKTVLQDQGNFPATATGEGHIDVDSLGK